MKTIQELLTLAETDEGKQQIRVMVAKACGYQFRDETWSEMKGVYTSTGGFIGLDRPDWHPFPAYHTSLDAIMPEVRKLKKGDRSRFVKNLCARSNPQRQHEAFQWAIIDAEAIHYCIVLLFTLQHS